MNECVGLTEVNSEPRRRRQIGSESELQ